MALNPTNVFSFVQTLLLLLQWSMFGFSNVNGAGGTTDTHTDDSYYYNGTDYHTNDTHDSYDTHDTHDSDGYMFKTQPAWVVIIVGFLLSAALAGWITFLYKLNNKPSKPRDDNWYMDAARRITEEAENDHMDRMGVVASDTHE